MNAAVASVVWLALTAIAAPPLSDDVAYQEGVALYEDFEYEKSVFRFKQALRVEGRAPQDVATVAIRLGMTYAELRDLQSASTAFDLAIENDPLVTLPLDAPPKIQRMLDEARGRAREKAAAAPPEAPAPDESGALEKAPIEPTPVVEPAPVEPEATVAEGGLPWVLIGGGAVAAGGALVALIGAAAWGGGVGLAMYASGQAFQDDAAAWALPSSIGQIGGQVALGVGVAVLVVGGAIAAVGLVLE